MPSRRAVLSSVAIGLTVTAAGCSTISPPSAEADETLVAVSDGDSEIEAISHDHVASVGEVRESARLGGYTVPVTLTDDGVESFTDAMESSGAMAEPVNYEMRFYLDGELKQTSKLGSGFVQSIREGEFDGKFIVQLETREDAESLRETLEDGR